MPADHSNIDLHSHTTRSDGTLSPTALVQRARANGVDMLALTDHDVLDGLPEAQAAARAEGLVLIPGVEVSITWAGETIHIVGLRVDPQDATLLAGLEANRAGRTERAREMAAELERCGVPDAWEGALKYVGNPALISRSHFGRHLVALGLCASQREVFDHWLVPGKPGYVPQRWASLDEAVSWIRGAGGVACEQPHDSVVSLMVTLFPSSVYARARVNRLIALSTTISPKRVRPIIWVPLRLLLQVCHENLVHLGC